MSDLVIPKTVESIEDVVWDDYINLRCIEADPKWLNKLPPKSQIERFVVPDWVLEVHEKDFDGCYKLKELIFEKSNTKLCGERCDAFENIESIKCSETTASSMSNNAKKNWKKWEIKE